MDAFKHISNVSGRKRALVYTRTAKIYTPLYLRNEKLVTHNNYLNELTTYN